MASTSGTFSTYPSLLTYQVTADELSSDPSTNTSQVLVRAYVDFSGTSASSFGVSGSTTAGSWNYGFMSFSGAGSIEVYNSGSFTVAHNADGTGSYSFSGSATSGGWGSASTGTGTLTLTPLNLAAGKRWTGSTWTDVTVNKRWNGSSWVDLTIKKRWNGSSWQDLS
jgi:hypothetical protein